MRAEVTSTFLHGAERFEVGARLTDEADAPAECRHIGTDDLLYFVRSGWARDLDGVSALQAAPALQGDVVELTAHPPQAA